MELIQKLSLYNFLPYSKLCLLSRDAQVLSAWKGFRYRCDLKFCSCQEVMFEDEALSQRVLLVLLPRIYSHKAPAIGNMKL